MKRVLLLAVLAAGLLSKGRLTSAEAPARPVRDIVLVTIDTCRADAVGFGGNTRGTTPHLDAVASDGLVFSFAHGQNVLTLPSHVNILTGLYPFQHGVRDNTGFRLEDRFATAATILRDMGYATGAFVAAFPLDSRYGLARGFDVYDMLYRQSEDSTDFRVQQSPGADGRRRGARLVPQAGGPAALPVGSPLRPACAVRSASRVPQAFRRRPLPGRRRVRGRVARSAARRRARRRRAADAPRRDGRPRRIARRARRADPRPLRLRGDAARAAPSLVAGPAAQGPGRRPRPAHRHPPDDSGRRRRPDGPKAPGRFAPVRPGGRRVAVVRTSSPSRRASAADGRRCAGSCGTGRSSSTSRFPSTTTSRRTPAEAHNLAPAAARAPAHAAGGIAPLPDGPRRARADGRGPGRAPPEPRLPFRLGCRQDRVRAGGRSQEPDRRRPADPPGGGALRARRQGGRSARDARARRPESEDAARVSAPGVSPRGEGRRGRRDQGPRAGHGERREERSARPAPRAPPLRRRPAARSGHDPRPLRPEPGRRDPERSRHRAEPTPGASTKRWRSSGGCSRRTLPTSRPSRTSGSRS